MSDGARPSPAQSQPSDPRSLDSEAAASLPAPSALSVWGLPAGIGILYLAYWQIVPRIQADSLGVVLFSTIVALAIMIWFNAQVARGFRRPGHFAFALLVTAVAVVPLQAFAYMGKSVTPWSWLVAVKGLPHLLTVLLATSLGGLLSFILRGANMIPPVAAVLALVDIWTVLLGGPVGKIVSSDSPTAQKITKMMTVPLPSPKPSGASPIPPTLVVGFADFLFIAFFVAAITRFAPADRHYRRMLAVLIVLLCGYMLLVYFSAWSLPALLPLAVVMIALHWRFFHYSRSEAFALLYAALFIALIGAGFWYMGMVGAPPKPAP